MTGGAGAVMESWVTKHRHTPGQQPGQGTNRASNSFYFILKVKIVEMRRTTNEELSLTRER